MSTEGHLARIGAAAAVSGALTLFVSTLLHPMKADPNDAPAAFAEYAAATNWVGIHLGQFGGIALLGVALVALAASVEGGAPSALARIGVVGVAASVAAAAALQAVDGVALKVMVDRWARASGEDRARAFEGAFAVRQIEIGAASLLSILFGITIAAFGIALLRSSRFPAWLGWLGLLGALGTIAAGVVQAHTGFSTLAMVLSMPASCVLLLWAILAALFLWRLAPRLQAGASSLGECRRAETHMTPSTDYALFPIGWVESALKERAEAPRQGSEGAPDAWLLIRPEFAEGLQGLKLGKEIVILTLLHEARRDLLTVRPRNDEALPLTGVFATRSPDRPNPIGLHRAKILQIVDECRLNVRGLEAIDGTPVIDIKPVLDGCSDS